MQAVLDIRPASAKVRPRTYVVRAGCGCTRDLTTDVNHFPSLPGFSPREHAIHVIQAKCALEVPPRAAVRGTANDTHQTYKQTTTLPACLPACPTTLESTLTSAVTP